MEQTLVIIDASRLLKEMTPYLEHLRVFGVDESSMLAHLFAIMRSPNQTDYVRRMARDLILELDEKFYSDKFPPNSSGDVKYDRVAHAMIDALGDGLQVLIPTLETILGDYRHSATLHGFVGRDIVVAVEVTEKTADENEENAVAASNEGGGETTEGSGTGSGPAPAGVSVQPTRRAHVPSLDDDRDPG